MITVFFCCFLQIVSCLWPEGEALLRSLWVFEGAQQLVDTVEAFAQELTGDPGKENAVRHFIDAVLGK